MNSRVLSATLCLCATAARADLSPTLNALGRTIHAETSTTGNFVSLADLQALITARADLTTAAVLTGEAADGTSATTIAAELANGGNPAVFTFAGPNRYSRNDAAVAPAATSGTRFGLVADSNIWTLGSADTRGVTHFGAIFHGYLAAGSANLVSVTATFSDTTTAVYTATAAPLEYTFVGFAAPDGAFITAIQVTETAGGGWMGFDDVAIVLAETGAPFAAWDGDGGDNLWSNGANWASGSPPAAGDLLWFGPAAESILDHDLAAGTAFGGIEFKAGAPSYLLDGNPLSCGPTLGNVSGLAQTLLMPVELTGPLTVTCGSGDLYLDGAVSGPHGIVKTGAGQLQLTAANSYSGGLSVNQGAVQLSGDQSAADGGFAVSNTVNSTLTLALDATVAVAGGKEVRLGTGAATGTGAAVLHVEGTLANSGALNVLRGATLNVSGTMTQAAAATIEGIGGYGATVNVNSPGEFTYSAASPLVLRSGTNDAGRGRVNVAGGTLVTGQPFDYDSTSTFAGRLTLSAGGTLRLSAPVPVLADDIEVVLGAGGGMIDTAGHDAGIAAVVSGDGDLTKTGAGTLTLSGANTFLGTLFVEEGTLAATGPQILPDGSALDVAAGAQVHLDFTGEETVAALTLGGSPMDPGTYDNTTHPAFLSGDGALVVPNPDPFLDWIDSFASLTDPADKEKDANPDGDAWNNLLEFGLDGDPAGGAAAGKVVTAVDAGHLTLTLPVLDGAVFTGSGPLVATVGGYDYRIDGSGDLSGFDAGVEEIPALSDGLPTPTDGWSYRTFRLVVPVASAPGGYLRADFSETP